MSFGIQSSLTAQDAPILAKLLSDEKDRPAHVYVNHAGAVYVHTVGASVGRWLSAAGRRAAETCVAIYKLQQS